ncbi:MAG: L-threonylcarbamoyladenylate synthase [Patescibacteria group bacterium]
MKIIEPSTKALNKAVAVLKKGGVIVCPTDTVYGFLADAANKKAVEKIYKIKQRPKSKPLPIFVKGFKMARDLAQIDEKQAKILKKFWPGKYTFILKRKSPDARRRGIYGGDRKTIAIRIPKYKFLNDLLEKINRPLVQTSVNISGYPSLNKIEDIKKIIGRTSLPMLIIDKGDLPKSRPSKIIDLTSRHSTILR